MMFYFALILCFVVVVTVVVTVAQVVFQISDQNRQVNRRLTLMASGMSPDKVYTALVRKGPIDALSTAAPGLAERASLYCRQAGLSIGPLRLAMIVSLVALALWLCALIFLFLKSAESPLVNGAVSLAGAAGLSILGCAMWITGRRKKRLRMIEQQLPLALDIVVRSLRAGHPVIMAIKLSAAEMGDPIGSELGLVVDETTYGVEFRQALANLAERTGSPYLHFFAISVAIQAETGGNLGEILGNLTQTIRNQQALHLRVAALASEGKMSAWLLSLIPVAVVSMVMLTQPTYYTRAAANPIFWEVGAGIAALYGIGQFAIYKIVNFKY